MQTIRSYFLCGFLFLFLFTSSKTFAQEVQTDEEILEEFTEVFYEFYEIYKSSDIAFVDYYSEDVQSMDNTGEVVVGSADYKDIWAKNFSEMKITKLDYTAPEILFSRDMMVTYNDYDEEFTDHKSGEVTGVRGTWLAVWKKVDGDWKVVMNTFHLKE